MEKKLVQGIYRVYDPKDGASYIGFSYNVAGTLKRLRFELTLNACSYKALQDFWNQRGELAFEELEAYMPEEGMDALEADAHLRAKLYVWKKRLGENTRVIQSQITF